ncbi:MAG: deoxyguanosinetriphosphate triphosphohydrolase [Geminicoccaceae bacterium]
MMVLAAYACDPAHSRGRLHVEQETELRTPFMRDRDRIIHSTAFRRLEYKTQVFVNHVGDHFRTRLTHSLEVAQITRTIARRLSLNEDLAEAVALAHDLGHSPFGHAGEDALDAAAKPFGGFDHNVQTLRVVTELERRYAEFDGLNLTWETLEGVIKHNGPIAGPMPPFFASYCVRQDLELHTYASAEAQVAAIADDIAYNNHDLDDGLRAGLFEIDELDALPLIGELLRGVRARYPGLERKRLVHEVVRRLIGAMVADVIAETERRLASMRPQSATALRQLDRPVVAFSDAVQPAHLALRAFLHERMYRHYKVNRMMQKAAKIVAELFTFFLERPDCLPDRWRDAAGAPGSAKAARVAADYIAGMTDRYAETEYDRLFIVARHRS